MTLGPEVGLEDLVLLVVLLVDEILDFFRKALAFVDPRFNISEALLTASLGDGGDGEGGLVASRLVDGGGVLGRDIKKVFLLHGGVLGTAFFLDAFFLGFVPR